MKIRMLLLAAGLVLTFCARADDARKYPIDLWYDKASTQTNGSTYAMIEVEGKAYEKWNTELNIVYQRLLHKLNEQDQEKLRDAERRWVAWHDSDSAFAYSSLLDADGGEMGTLGRVAAIHLNVEAVRSRTIQLMDYEELLAHAP